MLDLSDDDFSLYENNVNKTEYKDMLIFMHKLFDCNDKIDTENEKYFQNPLLKNINKIYESTNKRYNVDKYNIIIRENEFLKPKSKSMYSWKINENGEAVNSYYTENMEIMDKNKVWKNIFQKIKQMNKKPFTSRSIYSKIYKELGLEFPE